MLYWALIRPKIIPALACGEFWNDGLIEQRSEPSSR
jgi:hypothetical protein